MACSENYKITYIHCVGISHWESINNWSINTCFSPILIKLENQWWALNVILDRFICSAKFDILLIELQTKAITPRKRFLERVKIGWTFLGLKLSFNKQSLEILLTVAWGLTFSSTVFWQIINEREAFRMNFRMKNIHTAPSRSCCWWIDHTSLLTWSKFNDRWGSQFSISQNDDSVDKTDVDSKDRKCQFLMLVFHFMLQSRIRHFSLVFILWWMILVIRFNTKKNVIEPFHVAKTWQNKINKGFWFLCRVSSIEKHLTILDYWNICTRISTRYSSVEIVLPSTFLQFSFAE